MFAGELSYEKPRRAGQPIQIRRGRCRIRLLQTTAEICVLSIDQPMPFMFIICNKQQPWTEFFVISFSLYYSVPPSLRYHPS